MRVHDSTALACRHDRSSYGLVNALVALSIALMGIALMGIAIGLNAAHAAGVSGSPPGPVTITSRPAHPLGIPAIQPRAMAAANGARFTSSDVKSYIAAHPHILEGAPGKPAPTVTSVQFVSAGQASAMMQGESVGLPDASPVCVVTVRGYFAFTWGPHGVNDISSATVATRILVFDAQTGNLIIG